MKNIMSSWKDKIVEETSKSSEKSVKLLQATSQSVLPTKCQPTGTGLDYLIKDSRGIGGLPCGIGKITLLAGGAGSGKTRLIINLAAQVIHDGRDFLYIGFEFRGGEFVFEVERVYKKMFNDEEFPFEKLYYVDYYCVPFRGAEIRHMTDMMGEFYRKTKSPFVAIDSITETVRQEKMGEAIIRKNMDKLVENINRLSLPLCLMGVSQHRGSHEGDIAGGKGLPHKASAVVIMENTIINNFVKKYFADFVWGDVVRTINVIKTANYSHDIKKHMVEISETGIVTIDDEPLKMVKEVEKPKDATDA